MFMFNIILIYVMLQLQQLTNRNVLYIVTNFVSYDIALCIFNCLMFHCNMITLPPWRIGKNNVLIDLLLFRRKCVTHTM